MMFNNYCCSAILIRMWSSLFFPLSTGKRGSSSPTTAKGECLTKAFSLRRGVGWAFPLLSPTGNGVWSVECEAAHEKRDWLNIGRLSLNRRPAPRRNQWWFLPDMTPFCNPRQDIRRNDVNLNFPPKNDAMQFIPGSPLRMLLHTG